MKQIFFSCMRTPSYHFGLCKTQNDHMILFFCLFFFIYDKNFNLNLHAHVYFEDLENQTYTLKIKLFQKENYPGQIPM